MSKILDITTFTDNELLDEISRRLSRGMPINKEKPSDAQVIDWEEFGDIIVKSNSNPPPLGRVFEKKEQDALQDLLDGFNLYIDLGGSGDIRLFAYSLATCRIEVGASMRPVREGFTKSDSNMRSFLMRKRENYLKTRRGPKYEYAYPVNGQVYGGRSYIQVTWAHNYKRLQSAIKEFTNGKFDYDFYNDPEILMRKPEVSAIVLFYGLESGFFNGQTINGRRKGFFDYLNDENKSEWDKIMACRYLVNGQNKATLITKWYFDFLSAINGSLK